MSGQVIGKADPSVDGWSEIQDLLQQTQQENTAMRQQLEFLRLENRVLKDKLRVLCDTESNDSRTDNEKAMLLGLESLEATIDSRTASIEDTLLEDSSGGQSYIIADANGDQILPGFPSSSSEGSVVPDEPSNVSDPNWDILSSEGEGSVACLQDRIHQMEENHYTVNEELQATLQELTDLQENVNELTLDNEKLNEEKKSVIDVLYRQMEKVKKLQNLADSLKITLEEHQVEFDEEEFDESLDKTKSTEALDGLDSEEDLEEVVADVNERQKLSAILEQHRKETLTEMDKLKENLHEMEDLLHTHYEEKECMYEQLMQVKSQLANSEVSHDKVKSQLAEEKSKMADLLQYQDPEGTLNLAALVEKSSLEKEKLENQISQLQEDILEGQAHAEKLQEEMVFMEEDVQGDNEQIQKEVEMLKEMLEELNGEKQELETEVINLKESIMEMEEAGERQELDKQQHLTTISDLNTAVQTLRKEKQTMQKELYDLRRTSTADSEEWMQFQKDLQRAVVIANDYRNEAQDEVSDLEKEKEDLMDKLKALNAEVDRLRKLERLNTASAPPAAAMGRTSLGSSETEIRQRMQAYMKTNEKAGNRKGGVWGSAPAQPLSVKNLIKTIESAAALDAPKLPTTNSNEVFNGSDYTPPPRPTLERRNTTIAATKPYDSKPQYTRRASSVTSPTEQRKPVSSTRSLAFDDLTSPKDGPTRHRSTSDITSPKDTVRHRSPSDINHRSPDTPPKTPTTRSEARQAITDALFSRSDFLARKPTSVTSPGSGGKDLTDTPTGATASDSSFNNKSPVGATAGGAGRRTSEASENKKDPLTALVKIGGGGSKRNALLKWCQQKTQGYKGIDITNFSSSWNDGLAFCALMHNYLGDQIPFRELGSQDKRRNFTLAFKAAESIGITSILDIEDMVKMERPDWQSVMTYVTSIYKKMQEPS